jgi:ComF family protein
MIQKAIHELKYNSVYLIANDLASILFNKLKDFFLSQKDRSILVPIAMHPKKENQRGYNQVVKITQKLSGLTQIPVFKDLLIKSINTKPQMQIKNFNLRQKNLKKAYQINQTKLSDKPADFFRKNIILIDDVSTSGATLKATAEVVRKAGFSNILAVLLAKQSLEL